MLVLVRSVYQAEGNNKPTVCSQRDQQWNKETETEYKLYVR